jgi:deoxyadenosine/deoxycytidine kinase
MSIIIAIEGNIGTGKSTFVDLLKTKYTDQSLLEKQVIFLQEPVNQWETIVDADGVSILEKFYADQKTWSFAFQMMAYISRLSLLKKTIKENPNAVIFTERSLFTDKNVFAKMLHDDGMINTIEYQIYTKWFNDFIEDIPLYGVVYLQSSPEICFERVKKRSRKGETIPLEYLTKCHNYHDNWIMNSDNPHDIEKVIIDSNVDIDIHPEILQSWFNTIHDFIYRAVEVEKFRNKMALAKKLSTSI